MKDSAATQVCQICKKKFKLRSLFPATIVRNSVADYIKAVDPDWDSVHGYICHEDLTRLRLDYVKSQLEKDRGELSNLDHVVFEGLRNQELLSQNINEEFMGKRSLGAKVADKVAEFGGSWNFITIFVVAMAGWIVVNSLILKDKGFDPFPYILLNLMLSCLAAIQAPVIMMSQNRQEAKDRARSENDYIINLKAEVEIRNLTAKMDQLISHQWQTLMEIQQIQTEIMNEISAKMK